MQRFGRDCPDDWLERRVHVPLELIGLGLLLAADLALFGIGPGAAALAIQMAWVALRAARVPPAASVPSDAAPLCWHKERTPRITWAVSRTGRS